MSRCSSLPQVGDRVRLLPEGKIARVFRVEQHSRRIAFGLVMESTDRVVTVLLSPDEVASRLEVLPSLPQAFSRLGWLNRDPFVLFAEALRMRLAYTFDPHYAVSVTQVDLLPHQVEAVYRYIVPQPRIRFLLADDPGLGKTIEAGLVLKELKARGAVRTVLIVAPAHLQDQWRREMWEWFREDFTVLDRGVLQGIFAEDFFLRNPQIITSMDFAKQEKVREVLGRRNWDLVIVDEAHKFSATQFGRKIRKTRRYQLGEALAPKAHHLLFLTATPHRGDDTAYFLLLDLLEPRLFAREEALKEAAKKGLPFVLRRSKEQVTDLKGRPLFKRREVRSLAVSLTEAERHLYEAVTAYVRRWYSTVSGRTDRRSRNVALALTVLQRRLASSLSAVRESLRRRRSKLQRLLEEWERRTEEEETLPILDEESWAELSDQTAAEWETFQERLEGMTAAETPEELREEISELDELIHLALEAEKAGEEAKVRELHRVVEDRLSHYPEEKLLIFTEFKDTLQALRRKLEQEWGFQVAVIHGGMNLQSRIEAERCFRDRVQVMVATDAAGEGINLQFCRLMVNFDLPWNPNRLEQRMGRIHRYGQKNDVWVYNLVAQNTREGAVLMKVLEKLDVMREQMGSDRVYDVIDEWLEGVPLVSLMEEAVDSDDPHQTTHKADVALSAASRERAEQLIALQKKASLASRLDLRAARELRDASDEHRLQPMFIQRFFERAWTACGGTIRKDDHFPVWHIGPTPSELLDIARERRLPVADKYDTPFVFDKQLVSVASKVRVPEYTKLLGPGHPLFDALIEWAIREARQAFAKGALLVDPNIAKPARLWLVRSTIHDGRREIHRDRHRPLAHEQLVVIVQDYLGLRTTSPSYLLDCLAPEETVPLPDVPERPMEEV